MEPERLFSFTWCPYSDNPDADYSREPTTLVEFRLEPIAGGTRLHICESGFASLPDDPRRIDALAHEHPRLGRPGQVHRGPCRGLTPARGAPSGGRRKIGAGRRGADIRRARRRDAAADRRPPERRPAALHHAADRRARPDAPRRDQAPPRAGGGRPGQLDQGRPRKPVRLRAGAGRGERVRIWMRCRCSGMTP